MSVTPIRAATFNELGYDAGILIRNFDYSTATDDATLAVLVAAAKADGTNLLGATKGGITLKDVPTYFSPDLDGMTGPVRGARKLVSRMVSATGTLVELTADNLKDLIAASDQATVGNVTTITPRRDLEDGDYIDTLVWVGEYGNGLILVELDNTLNTVGLTFTAPKADNHTIPFEFTAHMDDPAGTEPYRILLFAASGANPAPALEVFSVEGASSGTTRLAVSPQATALQSYKYKTAASVDLPEAGDVLTTGWTAWDGAADVTATTGDEIVVALITTATDACVRAGKDVVKSKA